MHNYQKKAGVDTDVSNKNLNRTIVLPSAVFGGLLLITFFLLVSFLGYENMTALRFLNFVLLIPVIIYSLKKYVDTVHGKSYLEALRVSAFSFVGAYAILALFMFFYLMVIDPAFMVYLNQTAVPGIKLNPFGVMALLIGEGSIGAIILSYVILQYYKVRLKKFV